jgi:hypothetical protein
MLPWAANIRNRINATKTDRLMGKPFANGANCAHLRRSIPYMKMAGNCFPLIWENCFPATPAH